MAARSRANDRYESETRSHEIDQVVLRYLQRRNQGESISDESIIQAHPNLMPELAARLRMMGLIHLADQDERRQDSQGTGPHGEDTSPFSGRVPGETDTVDYLSQQLDKMLDDRPARIGRYRVDRLLGAGGFGKVYLAYDEKLKRRVAVKVPYPARIANRHDAESYFAEARRVASLDHAHIVPVYDADGTDQFPCFVVSKYIEGTDLAQLMRHSRVPYSEAARIIATVAEAIHHAHLRGLVHRDIKPENILIDRRQHPHVVDFGLALDESAFGTGPSFAGTPAFMSPEQARGEGHRVDGRSDIYSLGSVFYEMLCARRTFSADSSSKLLEQIANLEPPPPRQFDDTIPSELERICLRALAGRVIDRYTTAKDMADDLRDFILSCTSGATKRRTDLTQVKGSRQQRPIAGQSCRVIPKGLRSFDEHDADFFLSLLPGPRDRSGLPDSIRFWKNRIESTDPETAFSVGVIYGPSGCGKSSLVRAGLLPNLSNRVTVVFVEAGARLTESRLTAKLQSQFPELPDSGLREMLATLRRRNSSGGRKLLIVVDQFEQWLHAHSAAENSELVNALRQCNGETLQSLLLVRDDFWLALSRFMRHLELGITEGKNSALVDLFDLRHARNVLVAFGQAFGALPNDDKQLTAHQRKFIDESLAELQTDGYLIPLRLSLFAEIVKARRWESSTLKALGGAKGVGTVYLDESFTSRFAPVKYRVHENAIRAILKSLLPDHGLNIRDRVRARSELMDASGYGNRPGDFDEVLRILDSETRLITPIDPRTATAVGREGREVEDESFYQLSHDYLVPSLREWLTRKQMETWRGWAAIRLDQRAARWRDQKESRSLPSLWEYLAIRCLVKIDRDDKRRMMASADRHFLLRGMISVLLLGALLLPWRWHNAQSRRKQAESLVHRLLAADIEEVPRIVSEFGETRRLANSMLESARHGNDPDRQLRASLALLPVDSSQWEYLSNRLFAANAEQFVVIRNALSGANRELVARLWHVLLTEENSNDRRFRSACALATFSQPGDPRWRDVSRFIASRLVEAIRDDPSSFAVWPATLAPIKGELRSPLEEIYKDLESDGYQRYWAVSALVYYFNRRSDVLVDLIGDANTELFHVIFEALEQNPSDAVTWLERRLEGQLSTTTSDDRSAEQREQAAYRTANFAIALFRLNKPTHARQVFIHSPNPGARSYVIQRLRRLLVEPGVLVDLWAREKNDSIRRAVLMALGAYNPDEFDSDQAQSLTTELLGIYRDDDDAGVHAAAEWLLRTWGRHEEAERIKQAVMKRGIRDSAEWYVNGHGDTMVILGPATFMMGSPDGEKHRYPSEVLHRRRVRRFALCSKEVTVAQFQEFVDDEKIGFDYSESQSPDPTCAQTRVTWYLAAWYCNWLSKREGIPEDQWCYLPNDDGEYSSGMRPAADYFERIGYRLPSVSEWEFACRAGARTSRYYGSSDELLDHYAWYFLNAGGHTHPVGTLLPNDFGLFDMLGNVAEWCHSRVQPYITSGRNWDASQVIEDLPDTEPTVDLAQQRAIRGGSFGSHFHHVRCALRYRSTPEWVSAGYGIRVARSHPQ